MEENKQDKNSDFSLKLFGVSVFIYLGMQTLTALFDVYSGMDIPKWGYFLVSFLPALYFYQTQKKEKFSVQSVDIKKANKKFNWKFFGLSVAVYYITIMSINITLSFAEVDYKQYRFYSLVASIIVATYFYQTRKEKGIAKKDLIWISIVGVIVSAITILSYL